MNRLFWAFVIFVLALVGLAIYTSRTAQAQEVIQCGTCVFHWQANTESDMMEYNLYIEPLGLALTPEHEGGTPHLTVPHVEGPKSFEVEAKPLDIGSYHAAVTAIDTSGNESVMSIAITFDKVDREGPEAPLDFRVTDGGLVVVE